LEFDNAVNQPSLGSLVDLYHVNIEESSWAEPFTRVISQDRLYHVHLGDNNRHPTGKGMIDFPAIVRTLKNLKHSGYLSAELLCIPDPDAAAELTMSYMRDLLETDL
jgi:D-psicose/D-tagatose/L-ribulose 3-epimerase